MTLNQMEGDVLQAIPVTNDRAEGRSTIGFEGSANDLAIWIQKRSWSKLRLFIGDLKDDSKRDTIVGLLSEKTQYVPILAPLLWETDGVIHCLIQEILSIFPKVRDSSLSETEADKVSNIITIFQYMAMNTDVRHLMLESKLHKCLLPLLTNTSQVKPLQYLRLSTLGFVGVLLRFQDDTIMTELIGCNLFPLCVNILKKDSMLAKTVAIRIIERLIYHQVGYAELYENKELFDHILDGINHFASSICSSLSTHLMVDGVVSDCDAQDFFKTKIQHDQICQDQIRILCHALKCYIRMTYCPGGAIAVSKDLPRSVNNVYKMASNDPKFKEFYSKLVSRLRASSQVA